MDKLKTLKDMVGIQKTDTLEVIRGKLPYAVTSYELRQEAIKWIKLMQTDMGIRIKNQFVPTDTRGEDYWLNKEKSKELILWIKHFFNITEKDLKE